MGLDDHRFALASPTRPSATSKKSFSNVSWPILACMSFVLGPCSPPRFSAGDRNTPIAPSSNCVFHCVIWLPCTSYFSTSSASVLSPFNAAKATFALNAAVWFRLGLLIALLLCGRYPRPFEQVLHLNASLILPSQLSLSEGEYRGYLAVGAPDGSAIGRSQEGKSRRGIDEASFPLNV